MPDMLLASSEYPSQELIDQHFAHSRRRSARRHNKYVLAAARRRQRREALVDYFSKLSTHPLFR